MFKTFYYSLLVLVLVVSSGNSEARQDILKKLYEKDKKASTSKQPGFELDGEFGFLIASGNTNTSTLKTALNSEHETKKWSNRYFAEFLYKQNQASNNDADKIVSAQRFLTYGQFDYKLRNPKNRLFVYAEYDDDRFNGFRFQAALAGGYSSMAWQHDDSQLRYSIGPGYSYAEKRREDGMAGYQSLKEMIIRASVDYRLTINEHAKFRQFFSTEAGEQNRRSRSETSLSANVIESLGMKLSFVMIYNNTLDNRDTNLSTETSISLVYQFF